MNKMITIISVFDDPIAMETTIDKLNERGLQWSVFDPTTASQEGSASIEAISTPGIVPAPGSVGASGSFSQTDRDAMINAFEKYLASLHVARKAINAYVDQFTHKAKFVGVRVDEKNASTVIDLMKTLNPSRIDRHG